MLLSGINFYPLLIYAGEGFCVKFKLINEIHFPFEKYITH